MIWHKVRRQLHTDANGHAWEVSISGHGPSGDQRSDVYVSANPVMQEAVTDALERFAAKYFAEPDEQTAFPDDDMDEEYGYIDAVSVRPVEFLIGKPD